MQSDTSHVVLVTAETGACELLYRTTRLLEAPNWSPDGRFLLLNGEGCLWRLPLGGGEPEPIWMECVRAVNNDHGISPDGLQLVVSETGGPLYLLPAEGGQASALTQHRPSYYHGWSPDGRALAYVARENDRFDLFEVPAAGGPARRLTAFPAHDDGPDYTPDGNWIYFNSDRSGSMKIWRIPVDGAGHDDRLAEQVTDDAWEDWFPHPSPDGRWLVFLSYSPGTQGHPAGRDVLLRRMPLPGARLERHPVSTLVRLFGGQGTLNVNSWSPDGTRFACVAYERRRTEGDTGGQQMRGDSETGRHSVDPAGPAGLQPRTGTP